MKAHSFMNYTVFDDEGESPIEGPLVSIITSTWQRPTLLTSRCMPSVRNQTYRNIEHIVVSDGEENLELEGVRYYQLGRNWHSMYDGHAFGTFPRLVGTYLARGKYIGYLDDDDEYYPHHVADLVYALENSDADFAFSKMERFDGKKTIGVVGNMIRPQLCEIGTPMIMHHVNLLKVANWEVHPDGYAEDGRLVEKWAKHEGILIAFVNRISIRTYWRGESA